ncbi:MAG: DNA alkylation repair protein [Tannerellaceae bacterium]|nr:DNA alkylation repair protein [Tannerellaceae bacterium]
MQEIIKDICSQLRRAMNGIVSASMREKGVNYRLNFGVSLAKIREMAARYDKNVELARTLWKEDVREMKILATLLYPVEAFSKEEAEEWTSEIHHLEIAELYTLHMLRFVPFAQELAAAWVVRRDGFFPVTGFLLYALCVVRVISCYPTLLKLYSERLKPVWITEFPVYSVLLY